MWRNHCLHSFPCQYSYLSKRINFASSIVRLIPLQNTLSSKGDMHHIPSISRLHARLGLVVVTFPHLISSLQLFQNSKDVCIKSNLKENSQLVKSLCCIRPRGPQFWHFAWQMGGKISRLLPLNRRRRIIRLPSLGARLKRRLEKVIEAVFYQIFFLCTEMRSLLFVEIAPWNGGQEEG